MVRRRDLLAAAVIVAAVLLCYARTVTAGWIWDDDFYIWNNPTLRSLSGLFEIWFVPRATPQYYPLVHTSYWLEYRLWGDQPAGYHAVNLLLHAANALLLWRLLDRLRVPAAFFSALLFAIHPVCVESVAWATERKNTLSMCCGLGSLLAWFDFRQAAATGRVSSARRWYALSLGLFTLALLAKTVTVTLIGAIPVIEWWRTGRLTRQAISRLLPFLAVGLPLALFTVWLEKTHVGASGTAFTLAPAERLLVAGRAVWFYAGTILWPDPLIFFYPRWHLDARDPLQWLPPLAVAATIIGLVLLRNQIGRGPAAIAMLFCGLLFPALGFFDVYPFKFSFVADHFQYHAAAAALTGLAAGAAMVAARWAIPHGAALAAAACVCMALGIATIRQTAIYDDLESLGRDTLRKNPAAWGMRDILGPYLTDRGRLEEADAVYRELFASQDLPPWPHDLAMAHYNQARVHEKLGRMAEAEAGYREAIRLDAAYAKPRNNLATLLADAGRATDAIAEYESLLTLPLDAASRSKYAFNLGTVLAAERRWRDAEDRFREAVDAAPRSAGALEWLGIVLLEQGRAAESLDCLQHALSLARDAATATRIRGNLAIARARSQSNAVGP